MNQLLRSPSSLLHTPAPITGGTDRDRARGSIRSDSARGVMRAAISCGGGGGAYGGFMTMKSGIGARGVMSAVIGGGGGVSRGVIGAVIRSGGGASGGSMRLSCRIRAGAVIGEAISCGGKVFRGNEHVSDVSDDTTTVQPDGVLQILPAADGNNLEEEYDFGQIELLQERIHKKDYTVETRMRIKPRKPMSAKQMEKIGWDVLQEMEKLKGISKEEVEPQNASGYFMLGFAPTALAVVTALDKAKTLPAYVPFVLSLIGLDKAKEYIRTLKRMHHFKKFFEHREQLSLDNTALGAWKFLQVRLPGDKATEMKEGGIGVDEEEDAKR